MTGLKAHAVEGMLKAPISGRECIAYQVCVLFDTPGDARPAQWALQEQRNLSVRLGDTIEVSQNSFYLESPVEEVQQRDESIESCEATKEFLRQRGLFNTDGEFHFFEAILELGDEVNVDEYEDKVYVVRHTASANCGKLPRLPPPIWRARAAPGSLT
ncbi:MAG: hypothetical protein H0U74_02020 [Bradymonadaceae bacterium]|nr:hypothetical protein [Lujinxingiaceae bacterium]